ncbi:MAG: alanine racemase [Chloroflexi bacterium]|nr:alanine racemase [Chloroflexota bacterium]
MISPNGHPQRSPYTTLAEVDLDAIAQNMRSIAQWVGEAVEVIGVVKDDAYGHGAVRVARTLIANGATRLAVGRTLEGVQLRQAGIDVPILNMCYAVPGEAALMAEYDLTPTVTTWDGAQALSAQAAALGRTLRVHLKVDTGMGRYGLLPDEVLPFLEQVKRLPNLDWEGVFTHFSTADEADKRFTRQQYATFQEVLAAIESSGLHFRLRHAANSAATLDLPETHLDAVRPGIALYGLYPSAEVSTDIPLQPAITLKSHIARVRTLPAGSAIGYGRTYIAEKAVKVGLVPVGYGDGYHRLLSNRGAVLVNGQRASIIGRVCMDQLTVDLSNIDVAQDDPVVLIGEQGEAAIPAEEVAAWAETINYEVVTGISRRIPRVYRSSGEVVDVWQMVPDAEPESL